MKVKLGYVAISKTIELTASTNYTYTQYQKNKDLKLLDKVIISNLESLEEIIKYNIANDIKFYRISSKIIPLATKDDVKFDYINKYKNYYQQISKLIKGSNMRVDFHADQYTVLNSTKKEVVENTIKTLQYHYNLLESLDILDKVVVLHVGSNVLGKKNSKTRFINNFKKLPQHLQNLIVIENDDKIFNIEDVIEISNEINTPIVLDYHHHLCNKSSNIDYPKIFKSWKSQTPKMHFSSSKNKREFRAHNDYINSNDFIDFLENIKIYNQDIDIMLEAKTKDEALFRLVRELKYKTNYKFINDTTFIVE